MTGNRPDDFLGARFDVGYGTLSLNHHWAKQLTGIEQMTFGVVRPVPSFGAFCELRRIANEQMNDEL